MPGLRRRPPQSASGADYGYDRGDQEGHVQRARAEHDEPTQRPSAQQKADKDHAGAEGEYGREGAQEAELPRREEHTYRDGDGALEHHRARYVAEGEGVLIVPHPDDRVELLGQLRGQGREDGENGARRYADGQRHVPDGVDEDVGAEAHDDDRPDELGRHGPGRRLRAEGPQGEL